MGSGGRVGQLQILGRHNVCHALHFGDDDDDDIAWYGIGLFVGVVLLLLPSPLRRRSPPRPCVDARHDAGTSPLVDLTLDVVAFFCQRWQIHRRHRQRHFQWPLLVVGSPMVVVDSIGAKILVCG